jgi:hypothetical protein
MPKGGQPYTDKTPTTMQDVMERKAAKRDMSKRVLPAQRPLSFASTVASPANAQMNSNNPNMKGK